MPHYHEGNKRWKTHITSEVAGIIVPQYMKPGSVVVARDGAVYERMNNGSLRRIDKEIVHRKEITK
jgi:(2Fe-2S) ferredoxin